MILPDGTGPTIPAHRAALEDRSIPSLRPRRGPIALAILGALALLLLGFFAYAELQSRSAAAAAPPPLRFGVVRYLPADLVKGAQRPVVDYLALQLEREVELVIAEDDRDLEEKLRSGEVHAAALSPYAYVRVRERMPDLSLLATPVVSGGASTYEGYILSRVESDVRELEDLRGRVFCFVRPDSTSGYLYPRAALRRAGIDPDRDFLAIRFGGDHLETLRQLARGACDGAAVYGGAWFGAREHGVAPESFRLLGGTDRIPLDAYVAAPDLTEDEATALREAFLALEPQSPAAHRHLGGESNVIGFAAARDSAYDPVRRLARSSVDEDERQRASNRAR